jgi:hypothetical protein
MARVSAKVSNERRQQVWFLMLKGHNGPSIAKMLNSPYITVHKDIKFLTKKSKQYIYDLARGTHVLMYQRAIEGIGLTLTEAWNKFNDPKVPEKQKVSYLRLIKECNESMFEMTANGPTEMAVLETMRRIDRLGVDYDIDKPLMLTEQEQIENYILTNPRFSVRNGYDYTISYHSNSKNSRVNKTETDRDRDKDKDKDKEDLNHAQ